MPIAKGPLQTFAPIGRAEPSSSGSVCVLLVRALFRQVLAHRAGTA
jgi:hypothetical protein